jgi:nitrogen-specific signal transduction histidine kinase
MEGLFSNGQIDFIKFEKAFEEIFKKDVFKLTKEPSFYIKDGNHKIIINKVQSDDNKCNSYVYNVNTSLLTDCGGQISIIVSYEDVGKLNSLDKNISAYEELISVKELAASAAHEIKNPLFSIRGFVQLLESSLNADDKRREYTNIMVTELDRINRLIDDFLNFSLGKEKKWQEIDIKQLVGYTINFMSPLFESKKLLLDVDIYDDMPVITGSSDQLKQALINLIHNSIDATEPGGTTRLFALANLVMLSSKMTTSFLLSTNL